MDELAFPQPSHGATGMTLRDYFAAKAMAALIQANEALQIHTDKGILVLPKREGTPILAYQYADAMMKARHGD